MFKNVCLLFSQLSDTLAGYKTLEPSYSPSACMSTALLSAGTHVALELSDDSVYCALIFHVNLGEGWLSGLSSLLALIILEHILLLNALTAFLWS